MDRPMNLKELQAIWKMRDLRYVGAGVPEPSPSGLVSQDPKSRPATLSPNEVAAIRLGRMREVEIDLEPGERARGWAIVKTWVPPVPLAGRLS